MNKFIDRQDAGRVLTEHLKPYAHQSDVIVIALPRGGVPVAYEVAKALSVPLDVLIVRKLGLPGHEEFAMGALASGGTIIFNESLLNQLNLNQASIDAVVHAEQEELLRRERLYRGNRPFPDLLGKTVILVDDGMATGLTMQAAVQALRKHHPASIILAVPVAAYESCEDMAKFVDKIVCPLKSLDFHTVGLWYENFSQTSDNEVIRYLTRLNG